MVTLSEQDGEYRSDRFLRASDLNDDHELGEWKTLVWDSGTDTLEAPNGSMGFRWDGESNWNLQLDKEDGSFIDPELSFIDRHDEAVTVSFPYFAETEGDIVKRGVPVREIQDTDGNRVKVTTVYDLMMAHTGIDRGLPGDYPSDYDDPKPYTPAWQESITGVNKTMSSKLHVNLPTMPNVQKENQ